MVKRISLLALACLGLLAAPIPRPLAAQTVRLSEKVIPVLVNELRLRLNVPDTARSAAPAPARISDDEYNALVDAAVQARQDIEDPADLVQQEASAAQWGARDAAGADLRKAVQIRRANRDLVFDHANAVLPLLEKYDQSTK